MSKYAVPSWMLDAMPDRADEFAQLAFQAELKAVQPQLDAIKSFTEIQFSSHDELANNLVALFTIVKLTMDQVADQTNIQTVKSVVSTANGESTLTPDQKYAKARNNSVWYWINAQVAGKYADPGDMKAKNPESYRQLRAEGVRLYDEGKLTPSGKLK